MKIALCQINPRVGDLDANAALILEYAERAARDGALLAIFPELSLSGYSPRDLLDRPGFIEDCEIASTRLIHDLPQDLVVIFGMPGLEDSPDDPKLRNFAIVAERDRIRAKIAKQLLPNYDVFDEKRYFGTGEGDEALPLGGRYLGVTVCEDAWNHIHTEVSEFRYPVDPVQQCMDAGADLLINIGASPFTLAKHRGRTPMMQEIAKSSGYPLVVVNQVGGNDDILFDGSSALYLEDGSIHTQLASFESDYACIDLDEAGVQRAIPESDEAAVLDALVMGVRDYFRKTGFDRAIIGLSGGIDSALTAAIAQRALGSDHVLGIAMPSRYSPESSVEDAHALAKNLNLDFRVISIDAMFQKSIDELQAHLDKEARASANEATYENLQARLRAHTLMAFANRLGALVLNTGNKSEIACGYCTLYGDMAGALAVLSDVPKTMVYRVAHELNRRADKTLIPESTLNKAPSAELKADQKDSDTLPDYEVLDPILELYIEEGLRPEDIVEAGHDPEIVQQVIRMVQNNEYKRRQLPTGLIVTKKAFGPGRRYPIAQGYRR